MELLQTISLGNKIEAMALSPEGDRLAVVVGTGGNSHDDAPYQTVHLFGTDLGVLVTERSFPVLPDATRFDAHTAFRIEGARAVFRDAQTLLVARFQTVAGFIYSYYPTFFRDKIELVALDVESGDVLARYVKSAMVDADNVKPQWVVSLLTGLELMPPDHILLGLQLNVECLDAQTLAPVCSVRPVDEERILTEADSQEETIAPDGFTYDPATGRAYILGGYFDAAALLTFRFRPDIRAFRRVSRRAPYNTFVASSLCRTSDGSGLVVSLQTMARRMDLFGQPITDYLANIEESRALRATGKLPPPPNQVVIGRIGIVDRERTRWIDLYGDFRQDGLGRNLQIQEEDGSILHYGYTTYFDDNYMPCPAVVDDRFLFVATPSGFLQRVDLDSRSSETVYDLKAPVNALRYCPQQQLLLAGCADGNLYVFSL